MSSPASKVDDRPAWGSPLRTAVSLLLLAHLAVVVAVPLAMIPPASPLATGVARFARPYIEAGNVSHGYAFFAPDPGRFSHLVRYRIEFDDGRAPIAGEFPDLDQQWPRLLYHRHFMMSEQLGVHWLSPWEEVPEEIKQQALERLQRQARSYAEHLRHRHDAARVSLDLVRHYVPGVREVRRGRRLDDERQYETFPVSPLVVVERPRTEATP